MKNKEITYDNFLVSPLIAPEVAIAADTPQIDTALDNINDISLSIFNFLHTQNAKYHTDNTTTNACIKPRDPAFRISPKITAVPSNTKPILTYISLWREFFNQSGNLKKLPMASPMAKLKITASRLNPRTAAFPATNSARSVKIKISGNVNS